MKVDELREKYLEFFETKGHTRRESDVLVPEWDPSVLFTPAGMNQFKDHFLGKVKLDFTRATTCQKCLRTGDIENVGRTAYHHTFFEMLGNFSFGDYFKRDAIHWAWEFLTDKKWLGLDPARLSVTVYKDDQEAADIWATDIKLPAGKIEWLDEDENFWPASAPSQGPDGVCGPCSEIYYHPPGGEEVEIWNLVFTQFNRVGDPPDNLEPLPSKNIDTGMGLERMAASIQGVSTNYHIDTLLPIVEAAAEVCGTKYDPHSDAGRRLRRITDHVRACTFCIHEDVYPGPKKENYVVKRLLRRAVLDGHALKLQEPFLFRIVPAVVQATRHPYPELAKTAQRVADVIKKEEESFFDTIDDGLERIEQIFTTMEARNLSTVAGEEAADLYQTYGVPPELFQTIAAERNYQFDWDGFQSAMQKHGEDSGGGQKALFSSGPIESLKRTVRHTEFLGYETTEAAAVVKGIIAQGQLCEHLQEVGHETPVTLVLNRTPFYGESGGQLGDTGEIVGDGFRFVVSDTRKDSDLVLHIGHLVEGELAQDAEVTARVDAARRDGLRRAHSATHILHYALQKNLGSHAQQQGSKVDEDLLRFDFTNPGSVDDETLRHIEQDVIERIEANEPVRAEILPLAQARQAGAMMLFGEKYPDPVRMVSMGTFSKELCGGTHLSCTAETIAFDIVSEEGVAAGTRRIVALTGGKAKQHIENAQQVLRSAAEKLGVSVEKVPAAVVALSEQVKSLKKQLAGGGKPAKVAESKAGTSTSSGDPDYGVVKAALRQTALVLNVSPLEVGQRIESLLAEVKELQRQVENLASTSDISADSLVASAEEVVGVKVVIAEIPGANPNLMRALIDQLRQQYNPCAVLLAAPQGEGKVTLVAGVSRDALEKGIKAGDWIRPVAEQLGGRGGGKPDMAQAGGKEPKKLPQAFQVARATITQMLGA